MVSKLDSMEIFVSRMPVAIGIQIIKDFIDYISK